MLVIIGGAVAYHIVSGKKRRWNQYQNQAKGVLVKNGVDVRRQVLGEEKGEYFTGNLEKEGTVYVNPNVTAWRIVFDDIVTGERKYIDFTRQMVIGRSNAEHYEPSRLALSGDNKVSRNHCRIYEHNGTLCLLDLGSKNHTYQNGTMVTKAVYLKNGDVIKVGRTQLRVTYNMLK